jgi:hypothetical protein
MNQSNSEIEIHRPVKKGVAKVSKKNVASWFREVLSMAFYIGLFGGIGYLLQMTRL